MELKNFDIDNDNIAILYKEHYLDIHNNFDFREFEYSELKKKAVFKWTRSHEEWSNEKICGFELRFENVTYFKERKRDNELPFTEDTSLSFIGFLPQDMRENFDGFVPMKDVKETYDLNINFMSEQAFKINSETAECIELNEEIIYIPIDDEGTEVWRPMWADRIDDLTYHIKSFPSYDPTDENLRFKTGEFVTCGKRRLSDGQYLVAIEKQK